MQYALNYSGTRFLPKLKIKTTQFPGRFRPNLLEWKYDGTEPFHSNCSPGERLKRLTRLRQLSGQYNINVPRHRQKLLAWTGLACLQQLSVISRSSLDKCENCQWAMRSASRINTLREHCCSVPRCFWIYQTYNHSQKRSKSCWVFELWVQFRLGFGAKTNSTR